jgi:DNA-binding transcriptional ArsR family regulator
MGNKTEGYMSASRKVLVTEVSTSSSTGIPPAYADSSGQAGQTVRRSVRSKSKPPADHVGAVKKLAALAQETRLAAFRLIIAAGKDGCSAGALADGLDIPATTLSFHLASLVHADLVSQHRVGRQIIYSPRVDSLNGLITYMIENCCGADYCAPSCGDSQVSRGPAQGSAACRPKERDDAPRADKAHGRVC